jgi:hypothetical protein
VGFGTNAGSSFASPDPSGPSLGATGRLSNLYLAASLPHPSGERFSGLALDSGNR